MLGPPAQDATPIPTPNPDALAAALGQAQARGLEPVADIAPVVPVPAITPTFKLTSGVLTVAALAVFNTLALLLHTASLRDLSCAYQRQSRLERESLQAQVVARRRAEVLRLLSRSPNGNASPGAEANWRWVLAQLLADAGVAGCVGQGGVLSLTALPAPCLQVAGADNQTIVLTTRPDELRRIGLLARRQPVIALDASLHPAARDEMHMLWEYLARERLSGQAAALPRRAEWFLAVVGGE